MPAPPVSTRQRRRSIRDAFTLSVLIPVYNERDTIDLIVDQVHATPMRKEIICVNDRSTDGTQRDPRARCSRRGASTS